MDDRALNYPVTVTLFCGDSDECQTIPEKLSDAIAWLQGFLDEVPEECRDSAMIEIDAGSFHDAPYYSVEISYTRPATEEDKQARLHDEKVRRQEAERIERAQFERLKAKFGA